MNNVTLALVLVVTFCLSGRAAEPVEDRPDPVITLADVAAGRAKLIDLTRLGVKRQPVGRALLRNA